MGFSWLEQNRSQVAKRVYRGVQWSGQLDPGVQDRDQVKTEFYYFFTILTPNSSGGRMVIGGGGEIRTLGGLSPSLVFKTSAFNRSATPPREFHSTLPEYLGEC